MISWIRPPSLYVLNTQSAEVSGDPQLLRHRQTYCGRLVAVSKRRIVDSNEAGVLSLVCMLG